MIKYTPQSWMGDSSHDSLETNHQSVGDLTDKAENQRDKPPRSCERRRMFKRAMCDAWTAMFGLRG
jgi:hypothetical protein